MTDGHQRIINCSIIAIAFDTYSNSNSSTTTTDSISFKNSAKATIAIETIRTESADSFIRSSAKATTTTTIAETFNAVNLSSTVIFILNSRRD